MNQEGKGREIVCEGRWRGEGRGGSLGYSGRACRSGELVTVMVVRLFSQKNERIMRMRESLREREGSRERCHRRGTHRPKRTPKKMRKKLPRVNPGVIQGGKYL